MADDEAQEVASSNAANDPTRRRALITNAEAEAERQREIAARKTYGRGEKVKTRSIKDKKLRGQLRRVEDKNKSAVLAAKDAEALHEHAPGYLEVERDVERTYRVRQDVITQGVSREVAKQSMSLSLEAGPYLAEYTRNGKDLLLAGRTGHVATMEWRAGKAGCEVQLGETVRDVKWLHNNQSFAVAQKNSVYIYDHQGVEIHNLKKHVEVTHMEFLPYHYLLATVNGRGHLKYVDTSIGNIVSEFTTASLGPPRSLCQNPWNAILHMGHGKGKISLWSPNSSTPLVTIQAHRGDSPVNALAVDRSGRYMVSAGQDKTVSVWDIRNYKSAVDSDYFTRRPASSVAISDTNLVALGWGTQVSIWKDMFTGSKIQSPYMSWGGDGQTVSRVRWCPFEDVLGIGHSAGFSSIIVPGAGEANFDALEVNPYENKKQRQEAEVRGLLNKLQPEMISLNPDFIGNLDLASAAQREKERDLDRKPEDRLAGLMRKKARGKDSAFKKHMRRKLKQNIVTPETLRLEEIKKARGTREKERKEQEKEQFGLLARFAQGGR